MGESPKGGGTAAPTPPANVPATLPPTAATPKPAHPPVVEGVNPYTTVGTVDYTASPFYQEQTAPSQFGEPAKRHYEVDPYTGNMLAVSSDAKNWEKEQANIQQESFGYSLFDPSFNSDDLQEAGGKGAVFDIDFNTGYQTAADEYNQAQLDSLRAAQEEQAATAADLKAAQDAAAATKASNDAAAALRADEIAAANRARAEEVRAAEDARRVSGIAARNTAYGNYITAQERAIKEVDSQIAKESSIAKLWGTDYEVDETSRTSRISKYFGTLWGNDQQATLQKLTDEFGSPGGFTDIQADRSGIDNTWATETLRTRKSKDLRKTTGPVSVTKATDPLGSSVDKGKTLLGGG